jgi:biotin carboxylase
VEELARARRPRLLVLGAGPAQLGLLEAARARGVEVIAADRDPASPGFALADERAVISSEDEAALERLARVRAVDGVISPGADWPVGVAARIAERLGLPHPIGAATGALVTSKARQRERFAAAGVPHARALDVDDLVLPCVVKAPDRQGQRGLTLVQTRTELGSALELARAESRSGGVLVEEFVEGPEVTVNAISVDGVFTPLTVTDRIVSDPPAFGVALAHVWPSEHDTTAAAETARAAAVALGVRDGPTYTQLRLGPDGPRVMELAARLGGGHDAELCEAALGVDLNGLAIDAALGDRSPSGGLSPQFAREGDRPLRDQSPGSTAREGDRPLRDQSPGSTAQEGDRPLRDQSPGGACVLFLVAPEGELREIRGVAEAEALPGIRWVRVYRRPGWRFGPLRRGPDRAGAILAVGATREEAVERARRGAETVRFEVDAHAA